MKKQKTNKNKAQKTSARKISPKKDSEIYLDYASATPVSASVKAAMASVEGVFANPGGLHAMAMNARKTILEARKTIARLIDARAEEIVFTASATESNTLAIAGAVQAWKKMHGEQIPHVIVSAVEHPSIIEIANMLEHDGVSVTRAAVDEFGVVKLDVLKAALRPTTVLVSIMQANNEIGTIEPIDAITKILRHYKKEIKSELDPEYPLLHVDATQAFQYMPIRIVKPEVDLMTLSSGKIYGPRGIALLFVRNNIPFFPLMPGGGQEDGRRGGTEATSLIVGFAKAMEDADKMRAKETVRLQKILEAGKRDLAKKIPDAKLLGHPTHRLPNNLCFSVPGIESEYLVLALSAKKIYASSRSSCKSDIASDKELDSHVIMAIGGSPTDGTVRLSFGRNTTLSEVQQAIQVVSEAVAKWRTWSHAHKNA